MAAVLIPSSVLGQAIPVKEELADMVEQSVDAAGVSINISEQTRTSVNINKVNGRDVCSIEARSDVEKLQRAFDAHPNIYRNIGPALVSITNPDGTKKRSSLEILEAEGVVKGCTNIYVSVRGADAPAAQHLSGPPLSTGNDVS